MKTPISKFKPMLAATAKSIEDISHPCFVSAKLDGIRAIIIDGVAYSRSMKPIPNKFVQSFFADCLFDFLDGELIVGEPTDPDVYRKTNSAVMSIEGKPDFHFYVFDDPFLQSEFGHRLEEVEKYIRPFNTRVYAHEHQFVRTHDELTAFEQRVVREGYEGIITRSAGSSYKNGRSTLKEQGMVKLKRFIDGEAVITGYEELFHNENTAHTNELGYTDRSNRQEGLRPAGTLGALLVRDCKTGVEFKIGTGFSQMDRDYFWANTKRMFGRIVKYKYFPVGVKDKPRHPVFLGLRFVEDMS